mgnify:CR=1 FL=1
MNKYEKKAWADFQQLLSDLNDNALPEEIFLTIQSWLVSHKKILSNTGMKEYALEKYILMDVNEYPVRYSSLREKELAAFKLALNIPHKKLSGIGQFIRDRIEQLVIFEVNRGCINCGKGALGAYSDLASGKIVLECRQCG